MTIHWNDYKQILLWLETRIDIGRPHRNGETDASSVKRWPYSLEANFLMRSERGGHELMVLYNSSLSGQVPNHLRQTQRQLTTFPWPSKSMFITYAYTCHMNTVYISALSLKIPTPSRQSVAVMYTTGAFWQECSRARKILSAPIPPNVSLQNSDCATGSEKNLQDCNKKLRPKD